MHSAPWDTLCDTAPLDSWNRTCEDSIVSEDSKKEKSIKSILNQTHSLGIMVSKNVSKVVQKASEHGWNLQYYL